MTWPISFSQAIIGYIIWTITKSFRLRNNVFRRIDLFRDNKYKTDTPALMDDWSMTNGVDVFKCYVEFSRSV